MPKIAVAEYRDASAGEDNIRLPGEVSHIAAIAQAGGIEHAAEDKFWLGVPLSTGRAGERTRGGSGGPQPLKAGSREVVPMPFHAATLTVQLHFG